MSLAPSTIVALALAALVGVVSVWTDSLLAAFVWRAVVALVASGLAYELYVTRRLRLSADWLAGQHLYLGRPESLALEIGNATPRELTLDMAAVPPPGLVTSLAARRIRLGAGSGATTRIDVRPVTLGERLWPPLPVRVRGPLYLAWWARRLPVGGALRVAPDTLGPRAAAAASAEAGSTNQTALGGGRELHHLRPYRPGDPRHTIDWKATARTSRLVTRVFTEDQHLEVMLLVDAGRTARTELDGMQQFGHYANLAARFAELCVASDDQVGLVAFSDRPLATIKPARGLDAVVRIRRALTSLEPAVVESDVLAAAIDVRRLVRHRCLVVIMTDLYERSATSQLAQTARLLVPKHLPMIVGLVSER